MSLADYGQFIARTALDLGSILALAYLVYLPRHHRRDLPVAYVALNVGLFLALGVLMSKSLSGSAGLGVGFGLFGVLSIIRLRSEASSYSEVAYFFSALVLAVINGVAFGSLAFAGLLDLLLLGTLFGVDHPRLHGAVHRQVMVLDAVYATPAELRAELERRVGGQLVGFSVRESDFVRDITTVEVQYMRGAEWDAPAQTPSASPAPSPALHVVPAAAQA